MRSAFRRLETYLGPIRPIGQLILTQAGTEPRIIGSSNSFADRSICSKDTTHGSGNQGGQMVTRAMTISVVLTLPGAPCAANAQAIPGACSTIGARRRSPRYGARNRLRSCSTPTSSSSVSSFTIAICRRWSPLKRQRRCSTATCKPNVSALPLRGSRELLPFGRRLRDTRLV